jgi:hypothetical protein
MICIVTFGASPVPGALLVADGLALHRECVAVGVVAGDPGGDRAAGLGRQGRVGDQLLELGLLRGRQPAREQREPDASNRHGGLRPGPRTNSSPQPSSPTRTPRVKEDLDVFQRVGHRTGHMRDRSLPVKRFHYAVFVQVPMNPRQMSQTRRGQATDLPVVVFEELQMRLLQLFPVAAVVEGGANHGVKGGRQVTAFQRCADLRWCGRRRIMEDAMFMGHPRIVSSARVGTPLKLQRTRLAADIPCFSMSSVGLQVGPGGGLVVGRSGLEAAMQDADKAVT